MQHLELIGALVTLFGSVFLFLGALGVVRMPDVYNRLQAGTKASTLGAIFTLFGLGLLEPTWLPKIAIIIVFVVITNPLSSHALARAAHQVGIPLTPQSVADALAEKEEPAGLEPSRPKRRGDDPRSPLAQQKDSQDSEVSS